VRPLRLRLVARRSSARAGMASARERARGSGAQHRPPYTGMHALQEAKRNGRAVRRSGNLLRTMANSVDLVTTVLGDVAAGAVLLCGAGDLLSMEVRSRTPSCRGGGVAWGLRGGSQSQRDKRAMCLVGGEHRAAARVSGSRSVSPAVRRWLVGQPYHELFTGWPLRLRSPRWR